MDQARANGFIQMIAPSLVKPRAMEGTGFLGQAADDVYRIEGQDLYLVGTSEVPLAAYHSDEILDGDTLPRRYAAFSPCFRKEAGSHGKDTRGIFRVHWFDKVEMFVYTTVEESYAEHLRLLEWEKEFLDKLELAYRVIDVAAGDLGTVRAAQVRLRGVDRLAGPLPRAHLDVELHRLPDPPARHPGPLRRPDGQSEIKPIATLNGTLCSTNRPIIALLETHQQEDGSVAGAAGPAALPGRPRGAEADRRDELAAAAGRPRHRRHAAQVGRGRRRDVRGDRAAGVRRRAPRVRRRRAHRARPAAARRTA